MEEIDWNSQDWDAIEAKAILECSKSKGTGRKKIVDLTGDDSGIPGVRLDNEEEDEFEEEERLVYSSRVLIRGLQYYHGVAHPGEFVHLTREPQNQYDRNAIRVDNLQTERVGHIQREVAMCLAPLLDLAGVANVEATIPDHAGTWNQALDLQIYATEANVERVRTVLARQRHAQFLLIPGPGIAPVPYAAAPAAPSRAPVPYAAAAAAPVVVTKKTMAGGASKSQVSLEALIDDLKTPKWTPFEPANIGPALASKLFKHQLEGLSFLMHRENDSGLPPFWKEIKEQGKLVFHNTITNSSTPNRPNSVKGGLLADDMGLGKSIQTIALLLSHPPPGTSYAPGVLREAHEAALRKRPSC